MFMKKGKGSGREDEEGRYLSYILCAWAKAIEGVRPGIAVKPHGGISFPAQSQHLPLPSSPSPFTTSQSLSAAYSGLNSFSSDVLVQKSLLSSVFTVPGCSDTQRALVPALCCR